MAVNRAVWRVALVLCTLPPALVHAVGKPLSIPPSQYWDGKDGPWSTFRAEVGTPSQQIRLLPAHDQSSTWSILSEACAANDGECAESRGRIFHRDDSTTWERFGTYDTNPVLEERVGLKAPGLFGWDDLTLGWVGDNMPTIKNQSVVGITSNDFWIGSLPLNPRPINFTDFNNPIPSLLENLWNKTEDPIPSLSWSYTAGAYNLAPKVLGSLVLGGYDTTRFRPNSISFPFGQDQSLDFQVAIQSITSSMESASLLDRKDAIIAYISTMVADIWLPINVCEKFEKAFGLTWDSKAELYLMNSSLHQSLLTKDPTVRFTVGPETSGGAVTIEMPYWNFYHTSKVNATSSGQMYFPLKRAANDTQYILGRTFLQSVHMSVDYHRRSFNLSQALYPSSSTEQIIVAVDPPPGQETPGAGAGAGGGPADGGDRSLQPSSGGLSTGAIAGIAVGIAAVAGLLAAVVFIMYRRRRRQSKAPAESSEPSVQDHTQHEVSGDQLKVEAGDGLYHEVAGDTSFRPELGAHDKYSKPAEAEGNAYRIHEMPGDDTNPAELSDRTKKIAEMSGETRKVSEMPGDTRKPAEMSADAPPRTDQKHYPDFHGS